MAIDYDHIMSLKLTDQEFSYGDRESMLYALGVGMGRDPLDESELAYTFERDTLKTVPSMAAVLTRMPLLKDCGYDYSKVLHGEMGLTLHRPLAPEGELLADARVVEAYDKGEGRGALILTETVARDKSDGTPVFTARSATFARADGGFGGCTDPSPQPHPVPDRTPDVSCALETRADQALLYRLNGDRNPLHRDPDFAKKAGFDMPILHGLCSYGIACHAVLKTMCDYDQARMKTFDVRFSSPVFPGETQVVEMWKDDVVVSFRVRIKERDVVSINNGRAVIV